MAIGSRMFWGLFDRLIAAPIDWVLDQWRGPEQPYEEDDEPEEKLTVEEINKHLDQDRRY